MSSSTRPNQLAAYRATAKRRREEAAVALEERRTRALVTAREAAEVLRTRFRVSSVLLFGSLIQEGMFGPASDIDMAAGGLETDDYFVAVAAMEDVSREFEVDLVDLDRCRPGLRAAVLRTRLPL